MACDRTLHQKGTLLERIWLTSIVLCGGVATLGLLIALMITPSVIERFDGSTTTEWWFDLSLVIVQGSCYLMVVALGLVIVGIVASMLYELWHPMPRPSSMDMS